MRHVSLASTTQSNAPFHLRSKTKLLRQTKLSLRRANALLRDSGSCSGASVLEWEGRQAAVITQPVQSMACRTPASTPPRPVTPVEAYQPLIPNFDLNPQPSSSDCAGPTWTEDRSSGDTSAQVRSPAAVSRSFMGRMRTTTCPHEASGWRLLIFFRIAHLFLPP